jgi:hypothetical protein
MQKPSAFSRQLTDATGKNMKTLLKTFTLATATATAAAALAAMATVFSTLEFIRPAQTPKMIFNSPEWREFMSAQ